MMKTSFLSVPLFFIAQNLLASEARAESYNGDGYYNDCCCDETFEESPNCYWLPEPNVVSIGPEFYHVKRTREGGTKQTGWITAGRAIYDRIQPFGVYWGTHFLYGKGTIKGHSGSGASIKSTFRDYDAEGRIGFTFQTDQWIQPAITPFIGVGYFKECNQYRNPSPILLKFETHYPYFSFGFLSSINLDPEFSIGFNFRGASMYEARCEVSNCEEDDDFTMIVEDKINYRFELPVIYRICPAISTFEVQVTPFYEHRHYGGRENFPFDFLDTKLSNWGFNILMNYRF